MCSIKLLWKIANMQSYAKSDKYTALQPYSQEIIFFLFFSIKDFTLAFNGFKNKQEVYKVMFLYVKACIYLKCIQYTIH